MKTRPAMWTSRVATRPLPTVVPTTARLIPTRPVGAVVLVLTLAAATTVSAQDRTAGRPSSPAPSRSDPSSAKIVEVRDAQIEYLLVSNVAARRDGVVESIELSEGAEVKKGEPIGYLYSDLARLARDRAKIQAESEVPRYKAAAKYRFAKAELDRTRELARIRPDAVPKAELEEKQASVDIATAETYEAEETIKIAKKEYELAEKTLEEHIIIAPFDGFIVERLKKPGEQVHANEPLVKLANRDKLRVFAYVPLESSYKIRLGDTVEIKVNLPEGVGPGGRVFPGKITFIDEEVVTVGERSRRIYAEVDNRSTNYQLSPGLPISMIIRPGTAQLGQTTVLERPDLDEATRAASVEAQVKPTAAESSKPTTIPPPVRNRPRGG
ncbi:hypothetical protein Isop_2161 [Isosphaera pallida ATCC 43644]|uniref:CzcB-like barrel-sandwich hybrid domain-containing protein n=1 Tax=Isosphaera pallida (strain ATCC 43644 / DSM 9630 / IS1B) TaxID=575540 RepID=E8R4D9_ISOPI|nr:efflux RND transporter periplasmic adaptor subunit [Isosphaera pallida]ADV62740.1 hypothetical protein Isop_2161 [Isosphaera pallida ATCC 43644]